MADSAFCLDLDFTKCPEYIQGYAPGTKLEVDGVTFKAFEDNRPIIPEKDWKELAKEIRKRGGGNTRLVTRISNQRNEGSCTSHGAMNNFMVCQARQVGKKNVIQLSPMSLYKQIGSSPNSGSNPADAIRVMGRMGMLPLDNEVNRKLFPHVFPETGFYTKYPEGYQETAAKFQVLEHLIVRNRNEFVSALLQGYGVTYGRDGHCICCMDWDYEEFDDGAGKYLNSWGNWGVGGGDFSYGFGYDSYRKIGSIDWGFVVTQVECPQLNLAA